MAKQKKGKSNLNKKRQTFATPQPRLNEKTSLRNANTTNLEKTRNKPQNTKSNQIGEKISFFKSASQIVKRTWIPFSILSTIISIIGVFSFIPKVDVSTAEPFEPNNPFSTPFIISNEGTFTISQIDFVCDVVKVQAAYNNSMSKNKIENFTPTISSLKAGMKETVFCPEVAGIFPRDRYEKAELEMKVTFNAWWIPVNQVKTFRFIGAKNTKGEIKWIPKRARSES
jgi:hypothetical protein